MGATVNGQEFRSLFLVNEIVRTYLGLLYYFNLSLITPIPIIYYIIYALPLSSESFMIIAKEIIVNAVFKEEELKNTVLIKTFV